MSYDKFACISRKTSGKIKSLANVEQELDKARRKNVSTKEKEQKETAVKRAREQLLKESQPYLAYHELCWQRKSSADGFRNAWALSKKLKALPGIPTRVIWGTIEKPHVNLDILPPYSVFIQFAFTLAKPYLSRDENLFYIIDNPVRREKVFGRPYVAASSWKGSLRAALCQLGHCEDDEQIRRLFGNERGVEAQDWLRSGRLHFYPTFFDKVGLEVINPHDRKTRVGKNPILFESVPKGTSGCFTLLYVPFDLVGKDLGETGKQAAKDLKLICKGLHALFTVYGFGAKASSGFGAADDKITQACFTYWKKSLESIPQKLSELAAIGDILFEEEEP